MIEPINTLLQYNSKLLFALTSVDAASVMQAKEEGKEAADPVEPVTRTVSKSTEAWQVQNDSKPLWTRSPREVSHVCETVPFQAQHAQHACSAFEACVGTL